MRKKIRFFHQHTDYTCGTACILMLLDYYEKDVQYPTKKMEYNLYSRYHSKAFCGTPAPMIGKCLAKNNIPVHIKHSSKEMLLNRNQYFEDELYQALLKEYKETLSECRDNPKTQSLRVTTEDTISCASIREDLDAGKFVILECIVPGDADGIHEEVLHWILIYQYEGTDFLVCNPSKCKMRLSETELEHFMDTPVGRICIVVG